MVLEMNKDNFSTKGEKEKDVDNDNKHYISEKFHCCTDGTSLHGIKYITNRSSHAQTR